MDDDNHQARVERYDGENAKILCGKGENSEEGQNETYWRQCCVKMEPVVPRDSKLKAAIRLITLESRFFLKIAYIFFTKKMVLSRRNDLSQDILNWTLNWTLVWLFLQSLFKDISFPMKTWVWLFFPIGTLVFFWKKSL